MEMEDGRCLRADVSGPRTESGRGQGRDTRMCGDPKTWFPMRVTYQREMKVKAELDRLGIENFVPMRYKVVEAQNDGEIVDTGRILGSLNVRLGKEPKCWHILMKTS